MKKVRILIADDHSMVRQGVRRVVEAQPNWELCDEAANGRAALEMAAKLAPDIAVLDITMPELSGMEATRLLREKSSAVKVLILTMHDSETLAEEVLQAGAFGYLLKSDAAELLPHAINALLSGKTFVTPKLVNPTEDRVTKKARTAGQPRRHRPRLTPRERMIVQVLAEGKSNKEAASALGISVGTVDTHRKNILAKLGLHCTADLVRYAIRHGLVQP